LTVIKEIYLCQINKKQIYTKHILTFMCRKLKIIPCLSPCTSITQSGL
jgi:hypothetical protein